MRVNELQTRGQAARNHAQWKGPLDPAKGAHVGIDVRELIR